MLTIRVYIRRAFCGIMVSDQQNGGNTHMIQFKLKVMLAERNMSQRDLHKATGIRLSTINDIATGKTRSMPIETLDKLCTVLDCTPNDILRYVRTE